MKTKAFSVVILCFVVFFCACSTMEDFIIVNDSSGILQVEYKLKKNKLDIEKPKKISAEKLKSREKEWQELPPDQYQIDNETRVIKVKLAPNEALLIEREINYRGHEKESEGEFLQIESLSLQGAKGIARFEGRQALTQFKENNGDYLIVYR
jgi:hypothetical protein